jgi:hypothetical protein
MTKPICNEAALRKKVVARYGKQGHEVEREYLELLASCRVENKPEIDPEMIGKKKK